MSTDQQLSLPKGLPGFPDFTTAHLRAIADEDLPGVYAELVDEHSPLRFLLARPHPFFPGYSFDVDDATSAVLGDDPQQVEVWVLLAHDPTTGFTANLRGPVLVNRHTATAAQAVLDDTHPLRAVLA